MVFIFNPVVDNCLDKTKSFFLSKLGKKQQYTGKLQFPEINLLINKFVRKGHKIRIQEAFFKIFFLLKFFLNITYIVPMLCLTILFFSPVYATARLSKRKGKKRKKYERLVFKRMITFRRGTNLATRFVYRAIQSERKKSGCDLVSAGVIELFRLLFKPAESLTYSEYKTYTDSYEKKKTVTL